MEKYRMAEKKVELKMNSPFFSLGGGSNFPSTAAASSSFKIELYVASISAASVLVTLNRSGILNTMDGLLLLLLLLFELKTHRGTLRENVPFLTHGSLNK